MGRTRIREWLAFVGMVACVAANASVGIAVGETGLTTLTHEGQELLAAGRGRDIRPVAYTPRILHRDGSVSIPEDKARVARDQGSPRITQTYSWGIVECVYRQQGDRVRFQLSVTNTSQTDAIESLTLQLVELAFPAAPLGKTPDAGMFGVGGNWRALQSSSLIASPGDMPPVLFVLYERGMLAFAGDGQPGREAPTLSIPFTTTPATGLAYPFTVSFGEIAAGKAVNAEVSLRFGPADGEGYFLVEDVFSRYRDVYPPTLEWADRRPIGALFLATSQKHPPSNPRGWFLNAADVDVTTAGGLAKWRARLMKYADDSIKVLRDLDAQGMITWDVEGQEFPSATFYGDPRLASTLAPETDFGGALDEYFRKFNQAGIRTGITLRPQSITIKDGVPAQGLVSDPERELLAKIEYAIDRWGCSIFYLDSTYDKVGALNADIFRSIMERHPDILLLPENENFRDFAYTAPLNSFHHHGVTSTPPSVIDVYPEAFSVLMVTTTEDKMKAGRAALVEAVRRGDILLVNAWYPNKSIEFVKGIYLEAAR